MIINDLFINVNEYLPTENNAKDATVIITHGLAEYSKYYHETAEFLKSAGFYVITYDLRGHGKSFGKRGYVNSYKDFTNDLNELVLYAKKKTKKVFLVGHSLGGVITNVYVTKHFKVDGVIVSSAPTNYMKKLNTLRFFPFKFLVQNKKIYTNFHDSRLLTSNNYEKDNYDLPYYYLKLSIEVLIKGIKHLRKNYKSYVIPALFIHSEKDQLVLLENSQNLYNNINIEDKEIMVLKESYHNIFNDVEKEQVCNKIVEWITKRL